ncbi:MAG: hypothetical protein M1288_00290 [Actinobacteria bacterium]|jgi:heterodisulfide reductase subunit A-like polyferredoxin|nr:hypothetical protein [Actinomycetota bacterium]
MVIWFLRGLRQGIATTRYPKVVDPIAKTFPTPPAFRALLLTEVIADTLTRTCRSGALRHEGSTLIMDIGRCTACGECQRAAPEVVYQSGVFELSTNDRNNLVKTIPITGAAP